ncbi:molybdenum cofactor guanylyltransferase [Sinomicrobium sp. M5D2P17]
MRSNPICILTIPLYRGKDDFSRQNTNTPAPLYGLVLGGGESSRMGRNKALLRYHDLPQFAHIAQLLDEFCDRVVISSNTALPEKYMKNRTLLPDEADYAGCGPLSGVLTAIRYFPGKSFFVLGCDYPALTRDVMEQLYKARSPEYDAVCFYHPESHIAEPLMTIYEAGCLKELHLFYRDGGKSLRRFLEGKKVKKITPVNPRVLKSYDTPEDFNAFIP